MTPVQMPVPALRPRVAILGALLLLPLLAGTAGADSFEGHQRSFGTMSLGFTGGFERWSLSGLRDALDARAAVYAEDGFDLSDAGKFGTTYGYGVELQFRLTRNWFARTQAVWTRMSAETRDRQNLELLGGRDTTPVSLTYTTRVQTRPLLFAVGLGRAVRFSSVRWGLSGSWLMAPMKVIDELELYIDASTKSEVESNGFGQGAEALVSVDYFTDSNMTLYVEVFYRVGDATVELGTAEWGSTTIPTKRRVDLDGGGIRLGFRWI
jgi:hypothetical protein